MPIRSNSVASWLLGGCSATALAGALAYSFVGPLPEATRTEVAATLPAISNNAAPPAPDGAQANEMRDVRRQLQAYEARYAAMSNDLHDLAVELRKLKDSDSKQADSLALPGTAEPEPEVALTAEADGTRELIYQQMERADELLASEPDDPSVGRELRTQVDDLLAENDYLAQISAVECSASVCRLALNVTADALHSDQALVDSLVDGFEGGGMVMFDEETEQLVFYVEMAGEELLRPDMDADGY